jgi:hypothetical protein
MHLGRARARGPDAEDIEHGAKYGLLIDGKLRGTSGTIWEPEVLRWRYEMRKNRSGYSLRNPFRKRDFVILDLEAKEVLLVRRASFIPPRFDIIQAGKKVGRISLRSILRNKYTIELEGEASWTFLMPLYTIRFFGESDAGLQLWVVVGPSTMEWNLLMKRGADDVRLLSALAFIHCEWNSYG